MRYVRANELQKQTDDLFEKGVDTGKFLGFNCLKEYYNVKKGCTTYITGIPSYGKTVFHFELLINLSEFYGWKHAIFTPETGSECDIVAELAHSYIQKPFNQKIGGAMTQADKYKSDAFLHEYFFILQPEEDKITVNEFLKCCKDIKNEHGLDTFSIDPFNELKHDFTEHGGREDKYLEYTLGAIRRFAREEDIHIFIIAHPRTLRRNSEGKYDAPSAFELSGGAAWFAKAESIICIHREDIETNETKVIIQKAKPKHIGKKGECKLYFNWHKNRFYELSPTGSEMYASKEVTEPFGKALTPNIDFTETIKEKDFTAF